MSDKNNENKTFGCVQIIAFIGGVFAIIGISVIWVINYLKPMVFEGLVQNSDTEEYIAGAKITFLEYQSETSTYNTDDNGFFSIPLSKEYPIVTIEITHKDYISKRYKKKLIKTIVNTQPPETFKLIPIKQLIVLDTIKSPEIKQKETIRIPNAGNIIKKERTRIEEKGKSGYQLNEKWAWEDAVKDAKKKLADRGISYDSYDIDYSKSFTTQTENDGWTATVVIFTYK